VLAGVVPRLGVYFVQRYDVRGSMTDTQSLIGPVKAGRTLVFFLEGTFTRRAGMTAFYLGAFKVAAEAGAPVVPGSISRDAIDAAGRARPEPISRRSCNCGTKSALRCCRTAANRTLAAWNAQSGQRDRRRDGYIRLDHLHQVVLTRVPACLSKIAECAIPICGAPW
jgi:hypothetical protein